MNVSYKTATKLQMRTLLQQLQFVSYKTVGGNIASTVTKLCMLVYQLKDCG